MSWKSLTQNTWSTRHKSLVISLIIIAKKDHIHLININDSDYKLDYFNNTFLIFDILILIVNDNKQPMSLTWVFSHHNGTVLSAYLPVPVKCIAGGLGNWTFWGGCMLMQTSQEFSISVTIYTLGHYMSFCEIRYNKALFWGSPFYVCTPSPFPLLRYIEILERGKQISRVISKGVLSYLWRGKDCHRHWLF